MDPAVVILDGIHRSKAPYASAWGDFAGLTSIALPINPFTILATKGQLVAAR